MSRSKSAARGRKSRHTVHPGSSGAATEVLSILRAAVGGPLPIRIRCWDGSVAGDPDAAATVVFVRRRGLRRLLWAPSELGLVRAYVSGDVHLNGDNLHLIDVRRASKSRQRQSQSRGSYPRSPILHVARVNLG